jgi:O-methyltransferase
VKKLIRAVLHRIGYDIVRYPVLSASDAQLIADLSPEEQKILAAVSPFTMTSLERRAALINAINYLTDARIPGDIAECGVWRGGSMMIAALTLLARGDTNRSLYLYDTYEGMSAPTDQDLCYDGTRAETMLQKDSKGTGIWCEATLDDVRRNLLSTGYPEKKLHFIKGKVEDTIPATVPQHLALLRLDTDWYESTQHELKHLFPRLDPKGILILDDYGNWQGARKAVDEYFTERRRHVYLHRIDFTGRILVNGGT